MLLSIPSLFELVLIRGFSPWCKAAQRALRLHLKGKHMTVRNTNSISKMAVPMGVLGGVGGLWTLNGAVRSNIRRWRRLRDLPTHQSEWTHSDWNRYLGHRI